MVRGSFTCHTFSHDHRSTAWVAPAVHGFNPGKRDDLPLRVTSYLENNYATNIDDRKSVSGKFLFVGRTPVVFATSRQTTLATSSAEAELTALSTTVLRGPRAARPPRADGPPRQRALAGLLRL
jgi:hypothetical protein